MCPAQSRENMPKEQPTLNELLDRRESLLSLKETLEKRLANVSEEEKLEITAISERALNPKCSFDRNHSRTLYLLALMPEQVSWQFKLREKIHRIIHHH
jgi:hypothetical protein